MTINLCDYLPDSFTFISSTTLLFIYLYTYQAPLSFISSTNFLFIYLSTYQNPLPSSPALPSSLSIFLPIKLPYLHLLHLSFLPIRLPYLHLLHRPPQVSTLYAMAYQLSISLSILLLTLNQPASTLPASAPPSPVPRPPVPASTDLKTSCPVLSSYLEARVTPRPQHPPPGDPEARGNPREEEAASARPARL